MEKLQGSFKVRHGQSHLNPRSLVGLSAAVKRGLYKDYIEGLLKAILRKLKPSLSPWCRLFVRLSLARPGRLSWLPWKGCRRFISVNGS